MSAFIGPIHYWLYGKIKIVNQREAYIFEKASELCGSTAEELRETVWQTYGAPLPDTELSDLIDHDNIHGWLHRQIQLAESREAAFIKELLATCAAQDLIKESFIQHGKMIGKAAKDAGKQDVSNASGLYKILNDFYLNGMPCDQGDMIVSSTEEELIWESDTCLQAPNWKRAGADSALMMEFYQNWIQAFIHEVNPAYNFERIQQENESVFRYKIYKIC
ncbi:hypothetical protein [Anaerosinus massiliensis]|uniref:hypothetical protein n=1 Tax=Massilibacillus massiliensis TaxID=1806837 RepID=UPI000DA6228F|nr:hypothetical protein [Massilibacillus massiliensis]